MSNTVAAIQILPVLKAIRKRCLDCCESAAQVRDCPFGPGKHNACSLWPHRSGERAPVGKVRKAIRAHCLDCCGDQPAEVRLCPSRDCPLWPYRRDTSRVDTGPVEVERVRRE